MTTLDQFGELASSSYQHPTPILPPQGGRIRRTYVEDIRIGSPSRVGPHPLAPPSWAAAILWLCVVVAVVAGSTRLVLFLFGGG